MIIKYITLHYITLHYITYIHMYIYIFNQLIILIMYMGEYIYTHNICKYPRWL